VLATRDFAEARYLLFGTRDGTVKKTELAAYNTPIKADGIIAINIREGDELVAVRRVDEGDEVLMVSRAGLTVRFSEADVRSMGRDTSGVRGMDVGADGEVIAMDVARDDQYLLVVTNSGFGKRTVVGDYRKTSRGAKGVKTIQQTETKGRLAGALVVRDHHQLVFISQNGMVQRISVRDIRPLGRNAQGFRLMNIRDDDAVSAVALVVEGEATTASADGGPLSLDAAGDASEPALTGELAEDAPFGEDDSAIAPEPEVEPDEVDTDEDGFAE
jgi:DNA gyrase subunit A